MDLVQETIIDYLANIALGELQKHENMALFPLFSGTVAGLGYLTLNQAEDDQLLVVMETSESGSVPELKVENKADKPVLLLDGEELAGAKQNRVLNTTILLGENSITVIPVSCTEQGRWSYTSPEFHDSNVVMSPRLRAAMSMSVSASLREGGQFQSNQDEIWEEIDRLSDEADVRSSTSAMRDVFESRKKQLDGYLEMLQSQPRQTGLMVFINGHVVGFDILSRENAYFQLAAKLIRSYAMDALLVRKKEYSEPTTDTAHAFLGEIAQTNQKKYESVGYGMDYRFTGKAMVGSALVVDDAVIHAAFFRSEESERIEPMSDARRRRLFRI